MPSENTSLDTQKVNIHLQSESPLEELTPLVMNPQPVMLHGNAIDAHGAGGASAQGHDTPTDGVRQASQPTPTRADIERMAEERAMENPDYAEVVSQLAQCEGLVDKFLEIESATLISWDDVIVKGDLMPLINDVNTPNQAAREAAKFLNDHKWLWSAIAKGDDRVSLSDVKDLIASLKARRDELKGAARAEVKAELNIPVAGATFQPQAGVANGTTGGTQGSTGTSLPRPPPSNLPGMEGAMENLANTGDWISQQMMELSQKAAADPSKAVLYQQQIAQLQNQYQAITNMMNQLTQTISNLSKMWSDVAMNSIRNLK